MGYLGEKKGNTKMNKKYVDILLNNTKNIIILGHINPDGDCIGSVYGLASYIDIVFDGSKAVYPLATEDYNHNLDILIPEKYQKITPKSLKSIYESGDYTCIAVDCANETRVAFRGFWDHAKEKIIIDHHPGEFQENCISFKDPKASSCTCMLCDMMKEEFITPEIATLLYVGLCHDTGLFRNSNVNPDTYRIAGDLMIYGADHDKVVKNYNLRRLEDLKKEAFFYQMFSTACDGKVAFLCSEVTREQEEIIRRVNPTVRDAEDIEVSFTLLKVTDGMDPYSWRLSMRSKSIPINHICEKFGGGGHPLASGAMLHGSSNGILCMVIKELEKIL